MEVAMLRTAVRHTLSALAALALISAFAGSPSSAQGWDYNLGPRGNLFFPNQAGNAATPAQGLAAKRPSQRSKLIPGSVQKELSLSDEQ
jgi:hypothetical protein